jgi:hypothetical protein
MASDSLAAFLQSSFESLRMEQPGAWAEMCAHLKHHTVILQVDAETIALVFRRDGPSIADPIASDARLRTTRSALRSLLAGRCSLLDAVLDDSFELCGAWAALATFHDGLLAYLRGAVRSPTVPALLDNFLCEKSGSVAIGDPD